MPSRRDGTILAGGDGTPPLRDWFEIVVFLGTGGQMYSQNCGRMVQPFSKGRSEINGLYNLQAPLDAPTGVV